MLEERLAVFLRTLGVPRRLRVLAALAQEGETCVCHLEALLGMPQAQVSQHLMVLRQMGLVSARRQGRFILYRLARPEVTRWLQETARLLELSWPPQYRQPLKCRCPRCQPQTSAANQEAPHVGEGSGHGL